METKKKNLNIFQRYKTIPAYIKRNCAATNVRVKHRRNKTFFVLSYRRLRNYKFSSFNKSSMSLK